MKDINKHYVSTLDEHFAKFDAEHQKSSAQLDEINKYQVIHDKRDNPHTDTDSDGDDLWD